MSIEFIAQEFWDYVSESATPVALKMMEGNFLFVEIADLDFIVAQLDTTSTTSVYAPASTDYATISEYLTGNLTDFTNEQFSELISTWNATVTGGGGATGATLLAGTHHTLGNGNSYPKEFVGQIDSFVSLIDDLYDILGYTAANIIWLDTTELTLPDGTVFDFQPTEVGADDPGYISSFRAASGALFEDITAFSVAQSLPSAWPGNIHSPSDDGGAGQIASADPEVVFPTAIVYWEMQMQWIRDRMRAFKLYVEHTVGPQTVTLNTSDNPTIHALVSPLFYRNWNTGVSVVRSAGAVGDMDFTAINGTALPFQPFTASLGIIPTARELWPEQYDFENEQLYMYKSVKLIDSWELTVYCRLVSYTTTETYTFIATDGGYVIYNGVYASKAAIESATGCAIWEADPTDAWSRAVRTIFLDVTIGRAIRNLAVVMQIRYSLDRTTAEIDPCQYAVVAKIFPEFHYIWDSAESDWTLDEDWPGAEDITISSCSPSIKYPGFRGFPITSPYGRTTFAGQTVPSLTVDGVSLVMPTDDIEFPETTFNLQTGTPAPVYPTYQGAFVYDLELKKWGKMKMSFLSLLDFAPVNTQSSQLLPNARYGVAGGILDADGAIYQWDANPTDAYIKYGKFSLFRLGVTTIQEIEAQFGIQSTGTLETETSLDGKTVDLSLSTSYDFEGARVVKAPISKAGVWHNIILRGQFDLTYLQVNAYRSGRR